MFVSRAKRSRGNAYVGVSANRFFFSLPLCCSEVLFLQAAKAELGWGGGGGVSVARVEEVNGQGDGIWMKRQWGLFVWEEEAAGGQQGTTGTSETKMTYGALKQRHYF